ncbi:HAD-IC family P-type ATPase [Streptosporangium brasiliense]
MTGTDIAALDDDVLAAVAETTTIFARVSPEQKARLIRLLRRRGRDVGFLGDGVNDALALHAADVGIALPSSPLSHALGFTTLPPVFFLTLTGMVIAYLILVESAKKVFFAGPVDRPPTVRRRDHVHHMQRRASRFSHQGPLPGRTGR